MSGDLVRYGKPRPNKIKLERVRNDLTQAQLAELADVAQDRLSRIETGTVSDPRVRECLRIARALGVTVEYLFDIEKAPH